MVGMKEVTRRWMWNRYQEIGDRELSDEEIDWIMKEERHETLLLWWRGDRKDGYTPATGGEWFIQKGNCITLGELFWKGRRFGSCHTLYGMWLSLPIFVHKRKHSESNSAGAQKTRNAKFLKHQETGRWGLNDPRGWAS